MESNLINEQTETMKTKLFSSNKYIGKEHFFFKKFHLHSAVRTSTNYGKMWLISIHNTSIYQVSIDLTHDRCGNGKAYSTLIYYH